MILTKKQKRDLKWLAKQFKDCEENTKKRKYVDKDIKEMSLEELYNYNCLYVKTENNNDIFINVKKMPVKGGKFEYSLVGYDLIEYMMGGK